MNITRFFVHGVPVPKGSARAIPFRVGDRIRASLVQQNAARLRPWEAIVKDAALQKAPAVIPRGKPAFVYLQFRFARPKCHFRTGKNAHLLRDGAPKLYMTEKPDGDKLTRAVLDACAGVCYEDDRQVQIEGVHRYWVDSAADQGVLVTVSDECKARWAA